MKHLITFRVSTPILALALAIAVFVLAPATGEAGRPVYKGAAEDRSSFNNAKGAIGGDLKLF